MPSRPDAANKTRPRAATKTISFAKIDAETNAKLITEARRHDRTKSGQIRHALKQWAATIPEGTHVPAE